MVDKLHVGHDLYQLRCAGAGDCFGACPLISDDHLASLAIAGILLMSASVMNPAAAIVLPGFLALGWLGLCGTVPVRRLITLAWRLKWFFLSLLFFFGWVQPDAPAEGWERVYPSPSGLSEAGVRIAALILVVGWIAWFTEVFDRDAQIRGLVRWLGPLRPLGLRTEVFARRLFLSLDYFEIQRAQYLAFRDRVEGSRWSRLLAGKDFMISRLGDALAGTPPEGPRPVAARPGGAPVLPEPRGLLWQVGLLWLAVALALAIRLGLNEGFS